MDEDIMMRAVLPFKHLSETQNLHMRTREGIPKATTGCPRGGLEWPLRARHFLRLSQASMFATRVS